MKSAWMLLLAIAGVSGCGDSAIEEAKKSVAVQLKDPSSVQWRNVQAYSEGVVCGEFNAKNSMGGYTGFERFIFNGLAQDRTAELRASHRETDALCRDGEGKRVAHLEKELARIEESRQSLISRNDAKYEDCMQRGRGRETCEGSRDLNMLKMADSVAATVRRKLEEMKAKGR